MDKDKLRKALENYTQQPTQVYKLVNGNAVPYRMPQSDMPLRDLNKKPHGNTGKPKSEEHKKKLSAAMKGKGGWTLSEETRRRQSEAKRGLRKSDEHKKKLSESLKGVPKPKKTGSSNF